MTYRNIAVFIAALSIWTVPGAQGASPRRAKADLLRLVIAGDSLSAGYQNSQLN